MKISIIAIIFIYSSWISAGENYIYHIARKLDQAWKRLLLSEVSDASGWSTWADQPKFNFH